MALRQAEHSAAVPVTHGLVQYFTVQSKRPTMQVWQVADKVGVLPERQVVMQVSL